MTETWANSGDLSPFSELVPLNCKYFNNPRLTGRGGGLASIFKNSLNCRILRAEVFSSFELQLFQIKVHTGPIVCALIYRPPKSNKDFIQQFADFVSGLPPKYDRLLILGDFNIHVCCPSDTSAKDFFLNLVDSFNLLQHVHVPTQEHGYILDLVLSYGLSICNIVIDDVAFFRS